MEVDATVVTATVPMEECRMVSVTWNALVSPAPTAEALGETQFIQQVKEPSKLNIKLFIG